MHPTATFTAQIMATTKFHRGVKNGSGRQICKGRVSALKCYDEAPVKHGAALNDIHRGRRHKDLSLLWILAQCSNANASNLGEIEEHMVAEIFGYFVVR